MQDLVTGMLFPAIVDVEAVSMVVGLGIGLYPYFCHTMMIHLSNVT